MTHSRRHFLRTSAGVGIALTTSRLSAAEPIKRAGKPHFRLSLAGYSFHRYLALDRKSGLEMTLDQFIEWAAGTETDAVELTAYYFRQTDKEYLAHLKGKCTLLGLDISGTAVGNDFCVAEPGQLRKQVADVKEWVEHSSRLGAKTIRIFAGSIPKRDTEERARARCVEAIQESCDYAGRFGIFLALENHGGITATLAQTLALVKAVNHDWFGVNLDTGNFHTADPYADLAGLARYAITVQLKTEIRAAGRPKELADLPRLLGILRSANYRGYVVLEYEAAEDPRTAVPRHLAELRKLLR